MKIHIELEQLTNGEWVWTLMGPGEDGSFDELASGLAATEYDACIDAMVSWRERPGKETQPA